MNIIIRLTNKCTQSCKHCLFCCSEDNNQHMIPNVAKDIVDFLHKQKFSAISTPTTEYFQLMGGEIFLNPYYKQILDIFCNTANKILITTNGDWIEKDLSFPYDLWKKGYSKKIKFRISLTQYHNKKYENDLRYWCWKNKSDFKEICIIDAVNKLIPNERVINNKLKEKYVTCKIINSIWFDELGNLYTCPLFNYKIGNIYNECFKYDDKLVNSIFHNIEFLIRRHSGLSCITCQDLYKKYLKYCKNEMKDEIDIPYYYSCFEHDLDIKKELHEY